MPALLGRNEAGEVQLQVVKVKKSTKPDALPVYMAPQESAFGTFMTEVPEEEVVRELAIAQIRAVGQKPVWYDIQSAELSDVNHYYLADDLPLPDREYYIALTKLYRDFCNKYEGGLAKFKGVNGTGALEVGTKTFLKDGLLYYFIFKQEVSGAGVHWSNSDDLMDIITGEVFHETELLEQGYTYCGLSHSHNTMALSTPSGIDDAKEIGIPGIYFLHSTFTDCNQPVSSYIQTVTLTTGHKRFNLTDYLQELTEEEWLSDTTYDEKVFTFIKRRVYTPPVKSKASYAPIKPYVHGKSKGVTGGGGYWDKYDIYQDTYTEGDDPFGYYESFWHTDSTPSHLPGTLIAYDDDLSPREKLEAFMADAQLSATEISELLMEI
jgi:hypothetical protein